MSLCSLSLSLSLSPRFSPAVARCRFRFAVGGEQSEHTVRSRATIAATNKSHVRLLQRLCKCELFATNNVACVLILMMSVITLSGATKSGDRRQQPISTAHRASVHVQPLSVIHTYVHNKSYIVPAITMSVLHCCRDVIGTFQELPYFLEQKPPACISTIMSDPRPVFEARPVFKARPLLAHSHYDELMVTLSLCVFHRNNKHVC